MKDEKEILFEQLQKAATPEECRSVQLRLIEVLQRYATKICWIRLSEARPDVVNDAIFDALAGVKKFKGKSSFTTWFTAILVHKCQDVLRLKQQRRDKELPLQHAESTAAPDGVENIERGVVLRSALEELEELDRTIAEMLIVGENYRTVAAHLNMSEGAVRQRWSRLTKVRDAE